MPYGEIDQTHSSGSYSTAMDFTSQERDPESQLMFYRSRFYDPSIGRFLSPDTVIPNRRDPRTFNRYAYVLNNPVVNSDPSGHFCIGNCGGGGIGVCIGGGCGGGSGGGGGIGVCVGNCVTSGDLVNAANHRPPPPGPPNIPGVKTNPLPTPPAAGLSFTYPTAADLDPGNWDKNAWHNFWDVASILVVAGVIAAFCAGTAGACALAFPELFAAGFAGGFLGGFAHARVEGASPEQALAAGIISGVVVGIGVSLVAPFIAGRILAPVGVLGTYSTIAISTLALGWTAWRRSTDPDYVPDIVDGNGGPDDPNGQR